MTDKNIHLLRGDDAYSTALRIKSLIQSLGPDFDPSMNLSRLDGKTASLDDVQMVVSTLPFFGSSRLIIAENALAKVDKAAQQKFHLLLESVPPGTHLALIVDDHQKWHKDGGNWVRVWETLTPAHALVKWFGTHENAEIIDLPLPDEKEMDRWVTVEVKRQGGQIEPDAARELVMHTGNDTAIASQEIGKMLMYADFKRPVARQDVLELVSEEGSTDVFTMLDLLMDGQTKEAQALMHRLLDDSQPEVILGAVVHRFRQLILVREALDAREDPKVLVEKKVLFANQFGRYSAAARRYSMEKLERLYRRLLEMDLQAKTSQVDLATNLELFVIKSGI